MKRNLGQLANEKYDLVIVGGGIHGACAAWDAALRGLSTALIEKGDFGQATSANSLKTLHGGLRYLQDADLRVVRTMIQERKAFLRIAPHLVQPLKCVMPTYPNLFKSNFAMRIALGVTELAGVDRNHGQHPDKFIPPGKVISRQECLQLLPGLESEEVTGGVVWYDAQIIDTERLTLTFILSASKAGAQVANYVEATGFLRDGSRIMGVTARDCLTGERFAIQARVVLNATGPWVDQVLEKLEGHRAEQRFHPSLAMNILTHKIFPDYAVGLPTRRGAGFGKLVRTKESQVLFISPWREHSIIGTFHSHYNGDPDKFRLDLNAILDMLEKVNSAYPAANLTLEDICYVHKGFLPEVPDHKARVRLIRQPQVIDHQKADGIDGLVTVIGVKYTSSRLAAEKAIDLVFERLGRRSPKCMTSQRILSGGETGHLPGVSPDELEGVGLRLDKLAFNHLLQTYGSEYRRVLDLMSQNQALGDLICSSPPITRAEIIHAVREEMAVKLVDVVFGRTGLGSAGEPSMRSIRCCASIMAAELGWDQNRTEAELDQVKSRYEFVS